MLGDPIFLFCPKKRITHIMYVEKRVFIRIQHTIFCSKSKSGERKRGREERGVERAAEER